MKNRNLVHAHESARIYQRQYKPSLNIFRLLKSVMMVLVSGSSTASTSYYRKR